MGQDAVAVAGVDDHQEPATAQVGEGIRVGQDLQAAGWPEFWVSAAERDQFPDEVQQRTLVGALPGDGGALRVWIERQSAVTAAIWRLGKSG